MCNNSTISGNVDERLSTFSRHDNVVRAENMQSRGRIAFGEKLGPLDVVWLEAGSSNTEFARGMAREGRRFVRHKMNALTKEDVWAFHRE